MLHHFTNNLDSNPPSIDLLSTRWVPTQTSHQILQLTTESIVYSGVYGVLYTRQTNKREHNSHSRPRRAAQRWLSFAT